MADIYTLHTTTAFNAATEALKGAAIPTLNAGAMLIWFTPASSYDGTANFEVSPDNGTTWFAIEMQSAAASATKASTLASPGATVMYIVNTPSDALFRVRLSGGTQGTLTVKAKRSNAVLGR